MEILKIEAQTLVWLDEITSLLFIALSGLSPERAGNYKQRPPLQEVESFNLLRLAPLHQVQKPLLLFLLIYPLLLR